jgi:hypothetical protein
MAIVESYSEDAFTAVSDCIKKLETDTIHGMDIGAAHMWVIAKENLWGDNE